MKTIGICINNVIRNHMNTLIYAYTKYSKSEEYNTPIEEINPFDLIPHFPIEVNEKKEVMFDPNSIDPYENMSVSDTGSAFNAEAIPQFETNKEYVKNDEVKDVYDLMYNYASLEVFGRADLTYPNLFNTLKIINDVIREFDSEIILINQESDKSKIATLFFLSKTGFNLNKVILTDSTSDIWQHVDVLITDHPKLIDEKPEGKKVVRVDNQWNRYTNVKADYVLDNIMEITDTEKSTFLFD